MMEQESKICQRGCKTAEKAKKRAFVTLYRDELLYDIRTVAYVAGDVREEKETHVTHQIQDIGADGNVDRVTRMMDLAAAKCADDLYPFTKKDFECGTERDDIFKERPYYRLELLVPVDFGEPSLTYLTRLVHEFIVDWVLWDWLSITDPTNAEVWAAKAAAVMDDMKKTLQGRLGRTRKSVTPF